MFETTIAVTDVAGKASLGRLGALDYQWRITKYQRPIVGRVTCSSD